MSVSVVVPAFNAEKYIAETLESIKAQTVTPKELIIVDDGSTDDTVETAIKAFANEKRFPLFLTRTGMNSGIGAARQHGASLAKGDYVAFLSSDDCYEPTFLERCTPHLNSATATYTSYYRCNSKLEPQTIFTPPLHSKKTVAEWALKKNMYVCFSCAIFPRMLFNIIKFEGDLRHGEDLIFLLDSVLVGLNYRRINEPLMRYRIHNLAGTVTQKPSEFDTLWFYLKQRLSLFGYQQNEIQEAYRVSHARAFPTLKRKIASKAYHFVIDNYEKVKLEVKK